MTREPLHIGVIGCGSMGAELAGAVGPGGIEGARVTALLDAVEASSKSLADALNPRPRIFTSIETFLADGDVEIVVECASQAVVREYGAQVLRAGKSFLLMSSGALMDAAVFDTLVGESRRHGGRIIIPSGAVGGIDALRAVQHDLDEVEIISTKRPQALSGAPGFARWEQAEFTEPVTIFDGNAREAVKLFPANVNVAATVSLAGIGPERTKVKVIADKDAPGNVHEIRARGGFGEFNFRLVNRPHPKNQKTSHLAVLAAIEALRTIVEPGLRVGT